ncbi:eCIS core domain-containing protein [Haladaptatus sp. NG-SE-30]
MTRSQKNSNRSSDASKSEDASPARRNGDRRDSQEQDEASAEREGPDSPSHPLLRLQRARGNRAVQRLANEQRHQNVEAVEPHDEYEREADRMAAEVVRMPEPSVGQPRPSASGDTRSGDTGETAPVRRDATAVAGTPPPSGDVVPSGGRPLDPATRSFFEPRFGCGLGDVRAHTGREASDLARSLRARAYAVGDDIVFGEGQYQPGSRAGQRLLAHELAHVLQQRASHTRFVARNGDPEPIDVFSRTQVRQALQETVRAALIASIEQRSSAEVFADDLAGRLRTRLRSVDDQNVVESVTVLADSLPQVTGTLTESEVGYVGAGTYLSDLMGLPTELSEVYGGAVSFGVGHFVRTIANDITNYLIEPFSIYYPELFFVSREFLQSNFRQLLERLRMPYALLELELEGSLGELVRLRGAFEAAETTEHRAALGREIGRVSRLILLISNELEPLRQQIEADEERRAAGPTVFQKLVLEQVDRIETLRRSAETEEATRTALGDPVELLEERAIEQPEAIAVAYEPGVRVLPEQAFPMATDEATLGLQRQLLGRISAQTSELERLRGKVVPPPDQRAYSLEKFDDVYRRWFAFFSVREREADPLYQQIDELFRGLYAVFGHVAEGGIGRWFLMEVLKPYLGSILSGTRTEFAGEIPERALAPRQEEVGGTAGRPEYEFAELFSRPGGGRSERGERASRERHLRGRERSTQEAFGALATQRAQGRPVGPEAAELGLVSRSDVGVPIHLLPDPRARQAWSYLITYTDPITGRVAGHEEKAMPPEVSRYLLAAAQQYATLATPHTPGIGDRPTRERGIEYGEAASTYRYLLGAPEGESTESIEQATAMRQQFRAASEEAQLGESHEEHMRRTAERLLGDMEEYLSAFFQERQTPEWRAAAVLRISVYEHGADQSLLQHFTPSNLLKAIGVSLGIQALVQALRVVPYAGQILSRAVGKLIERYGLGTDVASIVTIAVWILGAGEASSFGEARVWAYFGREVLSDLGELIQGLVVEAGLRAFGQIPRRGSPPETVGEVMRDLDPVLQSDPEARRLFQETVRTEIDQLRAEGAGTERSDDRLDLLETIDLHLRGDVSAPDRPLRPDPTTRRPEEAEPAPSAEAVRAEAIRDYERLQTAEVPYGGDFSRGEFVRRYQEGLRFDVYSRRWYRRDGTPVTRGAAERTVRFAEIRRPEGYTDEQLQADLNRLRADREALFARLDQLRGEPPAGREVSQAHFNILKGNVAEILSLTYQRRVLSSVRQRHPGAELISGVRARLVRPDGTLGEPVQFTDNIIAITARGNLYVRAVFEVKSGPRGGQEATEQVHRWVERHLDEGFVLELPDGRSFRYDPSSSEAGQVVNLARAPRHIVAPREAERLGETGAHGVAAPVERQPLERTADELDYLVRRVLEGA